MTEHFTVVLDGQMRLTFPDECQVSYPIHARVDFIGFDPPAAETLKYAVARVAEEATQRMAKFIKKLNYGGPDANADPARK
jgi:hypothetical protein